MQSAISRLSRLIQLVEDGDADGAVKHWRTELSLINKAWLGDGSGKHTVEAI
jgi:hypothetical protein